MIRTSMRDELPEPPSWDSPSCSNVDHHARAPYSVVWSQLFSDALQHIQSRC
jgi:hypothetical protein